MLTANMTYQKTVTMVTEICCNCGVAFGIPSDLQEALRGDSAKYFYCPNGHQQHYTKSTESILRERIERDKIAHQKELEDARNRWYAEIKVKEKLAKELKRVHRGVCPCCNRSFINLQRHMKTKHPEVVTSPVTKPTRKRKPTP